MKSIRRILFLALAAGAIATLVAPSPTRAEEATDAKKTASPEETRARVPALDDYHDVIRIVWHDAWPSKDTERLRALLPEVQEGAASVAAATLPGILRDKQESWSKGVEALQASVAEYEAAAKGTDDGKLLDAAETLHARYEALVRIIRPALPELDAFHVVLYQLYHYDMPSDDLSAMRATIAKLQGEMKTLDAANLPKRLKKQEKEFDDARKKLSQAVATLAKTASSNDVERVKAMIEEVHARYEMTVAVCD